MVRLLVKSLISMGRKIEIMGILKDAGSLITKLIDFPTLTLILFLYICVCVCHIIAVTTARWVRHREISQEPEKATKKGPARPCQGASLST